MRFSTHISEAHRMYNELQAEKTAIARSLEGANPEDMALHVERLLVISSQMEDLKPQLDTFTCGECGNPTPIHKKVEIGAGWGTVEREENPPIFLDRIAGRNIKDGLAVRLCYACAIEAGIITPEELEAGLLPPKEEAETETVDSET